MRHWSLHPSYLDSKGLVALWREALLSKHVLEGKTDGYRNHPQLRRFTSSINPVDCINQYLATVYKEAVDRGYNFNKQKIDWDFSPLKLRVTSGQMSYETKHLLAKLKRRNKQQHKVLTGLTKIKAHPLFMVTKGDVETWEIVK